MGGCPDEGQRLQVGPIWSFWLLGKSMKAGEERLNFLSFFA